MFAELVLYIEETRQYDGSAPVFKLAELYKSRMEQLGVEVDNRVNSTRLKEKLLAEFPDMRAYNRGFRDVWCAAGDVASSIWSLMLGPSRTMFTRVSNSFGTESFWHCSGKPLNGLASPNM